MFGFTALLGGWAQKAILLVGGVGLVALFFFIKGRKSKDRETVERRLKAVLEKREIDRHVDANVIEDQDLAELLSGDGYDRLLRNRR
jgi:hypothetical protein